MAERNTRNFEKKCFHLNALNILSIGNRTHEPSVDYKADAYSTQTSDEQNNLMLNSTSIETF